MMTLHVLPVTEAELERFPLVVSKTILYKRPGINTLNVHSLISRCNFRV